MKTPPPLPASKTGGQWARQAAIFSLFAPFTAIGINFVGQPGAQGNRAATIVLGATSTLLVLAGFVSGIVALFSMRRYGRKGVLVRSLLGVFLNGLIVLGMLIALPRFIQAAHKARERQRQQLEQHR